MAELQTNSRLTYDEQQAYQGVSGALGTNREDLGDVVWDVSPTETPVISAIGKNSCTGRSHDWITDELESAGHNFHVEGSTVTPELPNARNRLSNHTQIAQKTAAASLTQEAVSKGGNIKSEMAYQMARRMRAIKTDVEYGLLNDQAKVLGARGADEANTPPRAASLSAYVVSGYHTMSDGTPGTGDGTDIPTAGTGSAAFSEEALKTASEALWNRSNGAENLMVVMGAHNRGIFSTFPGTSTRNVTTDDRRLQASIDVYDGDFHTLTATPDRFCDASKVFIIDPKYLKVCDLRPLASYQLGRRGSAIERFMEWEFTYEICNPDAHAIIADTSTS